MLLFSFSDASYVKLNILCDTFFRDADDACYELSGKDFLGER